MFKQIKLKFFTLLALALVALIFYLAPAQMPVILHKFAQVTLAAVLGYWLDRHIFPESRPSDYLEPRQITRTDPDSAKAYGTAALRRAIIIAATEIAIAIAI